MPLIHVTLDPEVDALFPRQRAANVNIRLRNGTVLEHFQPHRVGDPELPLSDVDLNRKFMELATTVMADSDANALLSALWALETASNIDFIRKTKLLKPAA